VVGVDDLRGARLWHDGSRHELVFGGSRRIRTMMQSCASAARLRGGKPNLALGVKAAILSGLPPPRTVTGSPSRFATVPNLSCSSYAAAASTDGRRMRPAGTSPVVANRHKAMSSFLARATIRVLRAPGRVSVVRARYHCASALASWNRRKRQVNWIMPRRTRALPTLAKPLLAPPGPALVRRAGEPRVARHCTAVAHAA
jgi:hypothetical protein